MYGIFLKLKYIILNTTYLPRSSICTVDSILNNNHIFGLLTFLCLPEIDIHLQIFVKCVFCKEIFSIFSYWLVTFQTPSHIKKIWICLNYTSASPQFVRYYSLTHDFTYAISPFLVDRFWSFFTVSTTRIWWGRHFWWLQECKCLVSVGGLEF